MVRIAISAVLAFLSGLVLTLASFVLALIYVVARGKTMTVPGLVEYTHTEAAITVQPSGAIPVVLVVLIVLTFPVVYRLMRRSRQQ